MHVRPLDVHWPIFIPAQASRTGVQDAAGSRKVVKSSGSHLNSQRKRWSIHHAPRGSSCTSVTQTGAQSVERSREGDGWEGAGSTQTGRGGAVHAHLKPAVCDIDIGSVTNGFWRLFSKPPSRFSVSEWCPRCIAPNYMILNVQFYFLERPSLQTLIFWRASASELAPSYTRATRRF